MDNETIPHLIVNFIRGWMIGQVEQRAVAKQQFCSAIVHLSGGFEVVKMPQMNLNPILLNASVPFPMLKIHAFESGRVVLTNPAVGEVFRLSDHAQIGASIVQSIMIDVINDKAFRRLNQFTMQTEDELAVVDGEAADGVVFGVHAPAETGCPFVISIIKAGVNRQISTAEQQKFLHSEAAFRGKNWAEKQEESSEITD